MQMPLVGWLFRDAKVIPIAPRAEDSKVMEQAFDEVAEALAAEGVVCIFPEGMVSRDGELNPFRPGIEKMIARTPAPVVPIALIGMWGSFFSYFWGKPLSKPFQRFRSKVKVAIGEPMAPEKVTAAGLAKRVADLGGWAVPPSHASAK